MMRRMENHALRIGVIAQIAVAMLAFTFALSTRVAARRQSNERVIDVIADHDSRFKIPGQEQPVITVKAGETIHLRITAVKAKNHNRDGSVHGFALLRPGDHRVVPGWDLLLKPGVQEFDLKAPDQPGEYLVVCTVICSSGHERMTMKFIVESAAQ